MMTSPSSEPLSAQRKRRLAILARASRDELEAAAASLGALPAATDLRPPEAGMAMVRGRIGGDGAAFNAGEATVSRASVRLESGVTGVAYVLGRDVAKARLAALLDALGETPAHGEAIAALVSRIERRIADDRAAEARRVAATKVDFFTLVRGANQ